MRSESRTYQSSASVGVCMAAMATSDAVAVLHGGSGCDVRVHSLLHHHNPTGDPHHRVLCTKVTEPDLVLDPAGLLKGFVHDVIQRTGAKLVLVTSVSFVEVTGMDHDHISQEFREFTEVPVLYVYSPDFTGDLFDGYEKALDVLVDRFSREFSTTTKETSGRVNLLGYLYDRPFGDHEGNVGEMRRCLRSIDLDANVIMMDGGETARLERLAEAQLSVAMPWGLSAARRLEENLGMPSVRTGFPLGIQATGEWLRRTAGATGREDHAGRFIDREEDRVRSLIRQVRSGLSDHQVALFADGHKMAGLLGLCRDLGLRPSIAGVLDGRVDVLGDHGWSDLEVMNDPGQNRIYRRLKEADRDSEIDFVIGTSQEVAAARDLHISAMEFGFPCHGYQALVPAPYFGYEGVLTMTTRILEALH